MENSQSISSIARLILERWDTVGLQISAQERQQVFNCIQTNYLLNPSITGKINRHILVYPPPALDRTWLRMIDTNLYSLMTETQSMAERENLACSFVTIFTLLTPLVYFDAILNLQVYDDFFMSYIELAYLLRLAIPRSVSEAERMYNAILAMPMVYQHTTMNGIQLIPQPFRAQFCFVMLFLRPDVPESDLWRFQKACLERCPRYLLAYPAMFQAGYSSRPAFWMGYNVDDPTLRAIIAERGSVEVRCDLIHAQAYTASRAAAAAALAEPVRLPRPQKQPILPAQQALVALLTEFEDFLAQHAADRYAQLKPGISEDQLEQLNALLTPLRLPDDVATLYRWHNGTEHGATLFGHLDFLPLEEALATYRDDNEFGVEFPWCTVWFPICQSYDRRLIPLTEQANDHAPVLWNDSHDPTIVVDYSSISALIATYVAAYQTGVIAIDPATGWWRCDDEGLATLRAIHDPSADTQRISYDIYEPEDWPAAWQPYAIGER
ncbi:SMI1/KNR4 family protein [Herpetosiphon llansteffanensis]|uniref:SMI1/KNR4 family protein n=1 Tax=Herpetosiphon llansteffanensis TaxID=2094568 RepID=UPI000D7BA68C|nr:SMI1/KNR4 family protein [Herpetosiphon llansteffanensis]